MILLANGCSKTAGSEIEYYMQEECKERAWPKHLGSMLGCDVVNLAEVGSCNERIKRTTIEWLIKNTEIQNKYNPKDITVILMWSGFDRFEEWNSRLNRFVSSQSDSFYDEKLPEYKEYAMLKTVINTWASNEYKNLYEVFLTATYLEQRGINYYFMNGVQSWHTRDQFLNTGMVQEFNTIYQGYGQHRINRHLAFHNEMELPKYQL